jgi:signal transduction histidine kinase
MAFRVVWPDASIHYLDTNGRAFYDESGRLTRMLGTTRDVTDRQELEERLRQAQKMEAVGQLAGGIAHDFNNMLNVILGYSDLLLAKALPGDPVYRRAAEIRKAGQHAAALTQQLLAFSRKKVLKPRVLNLANVLAPMELMLRSTLGAHIEIVTAVDEHLGHVRIDPNQMQQVFMNLAVNARDAMPRGGKLRFEFKNATLDESMAKAHAAPAGSYVTLAVSDNGSGMTAEVQKRIFEPFFTTKKVGQGTGLGLANVYGILQQSGGHIRLHSELGVGTTFQLFFPTVEQPADPAPRESPDSALTGEGTVLVVEDNTGLRALTEEILSSAGYKVLVAEDGDSALSLARDYSGSIQLLLTDIILPKMSGQEIATRLAALRPEIEVLFTSGYNRDATAHIGALDPRANFIQKPWSPQGLCEEVHALLNA